MTAFLPPNLMSLFEARPPIPYLPPVQELLADRNAKLPETRFQGIAEYVKEFEDPVDTPPKPVVETKAEKRDRKRREKEELLAYKVEQGIAQWNPAENKTATEDPYRTLFVARINYETSENKLRREFEEYGKIRKLNMVHDQNGKPRGYAFIEYSDKAEMHGAYKKADGIKMDNRRLVVDYERGRTQKSWLPRRLGGGKGDTRRARESKKAMEEREVTNGGGFREDRERRDSRERSDSRKRRSRSRERDDRRSYGGGRSEGRSDGGERRGYRGGPTVQSYSAGAGVFNGSGGDRGGSSGGSHGSYGGRGGGRDYGRDKYNDHGGSRDYGSRDRRY